MWGTILVFCGCLFKAFPSGYSIIRSIYNQSPFGVLAIQEITEYKIATASFFVFRGITTRENGAEPALKTRSTTAFVPDMVRCLHRPSEPTLTFLLRPSLPLHLDEIFHVLRSDGDSSSACLRELRGGRARGHRSTPLASPPCRIRTCWNPCVIQSSESHTE